MSGFSRTLERYSAGPLTLVSRTFDVRVPTAVARGACFERVENMSVLGNCLAAHPTFLDQ